ncbi:MAG: FAD-dependent oxidoreductase [Candidatus Bathyarchaeota archaeon]|nr:FAD-dependent oxidoreductase [Candidatus Bathyarchaeota archaeon]
MSRKIVVVGGGYGGTEVIRQLINRGVRNIEIELISNKRNFENTIGGVEIISEKVKPDELRYDLTELSSYWNFSLTIDSVESVDLNRKVVKTENKEKDYDALIVAIGSEPNFFNIGGTDLALTAYSLSDFGVINERLKQLNRDSPNVVIVGAGFVGLEVAAEVLDLFKAMKKDVKVTVVEKMNSVLPAYNNDIAKKIAFEHFTSRGVKIILGKGVKQIEKEKVVLEDENPIETDLTIWTAGIKSSRTASKIVGASLYRGYIEVDEKLLITGAKDSFAMGDVAFVKINGKDAQKMAGEALEQGKTVAKNISLIANGQKPNFSHVINYTTDFPKVLLSMGKGKAMLIFGSQYVSTGATEYFLKKRVDVDEIMGRFPQ